MLRNGFYYFEYCFKFLSIFWLIGFILCSCLTKNQKDNNRDVGQDWSYENNVRVLSYLSDGTMDYIFSNCEPLEFSLDDFIKIDTILNRFIEEYNVIQLIEYNKYREKFQRNNIDKYYFIIKEVEYYSRQYIGIINSNGEKEVWVNCFPNSSKGIPEEILFIADGGTDFFNLKINLTKDVYYDFFVNGHA